MSGRDIALTGVPRSGTTLACRLLGQCRNTVALFEPMPVLTLPQEHGLALAQVLDFYRDVRTRIAREHNAPSKVRGGAVPDNLYAEAGSDGRRQLQAHPGLLQVPADLPDDFTLVIKHNAAFTALLPKLAMQLDTFAIVRNPLAVIASWQSVDVPVQQGRVPAGERLDPQLAARLNASNDVLERQLRVLDWFFQQFHSHLPLQRVLRYEDIVASHGALLHARVGASGSADATLQAHNLASRRDPAAIETVRCALHEFPGAWRHWYEPAEIDAALVAQPGGAG